MRTPNLLARRATTTARAQSAPLRWSRTMSNPLRPLLVALPLLTACTQASLSDPVDTRAQSLTTSTTTSGTTVTTSTTSTTLTTSTQSTRAVLVTDLPDKDGDGVPDVRDRCADTPMRKNLVGFDGCPIVHASPRCPNDDSPPTLKDVRLDVERIWTRRASDAVDAPARNALRITGRVATEDRCKTTTEVFLRAQVSTMQPNTAPIAGNWSNWFKCPVADGEVGPCTMEFGALGLRDTSVADPTAPAAYDWSNPIPNPSNRSYVNVEAALRLQDEALNTTDIGMATPAQAPAGVAPGFQRCARIGHVVGGLYAAGNDAMCAPACGVEGLAPSLTGVGISSASITSLDNPALRVLGSDVVQGNFRLEARVDAIVGDQKSCGSASAPMPSLDGPVMLSVDGQRPLPAVCSVSYSNANGESATRRFWKSQISCVANGNMVVTGASTIRVLGVERALDVDHNTTTSAQFERTFPVAM